MIYEFSHAMSKFFQPLDNLTDTHFRETLFYT